MIGFFVFESLVHIWLSKRFRNAALCYGIVQQIVCVVVSQEVIWNAKYNIDNNDLDFLLAAFCTTYALLSYHDGYLLFSSIFCYLYVFQKAYFMVENNFRLFRLVTYYLMGFFYIFLLARAFHKTQRETFKKTHQQK
jgi:hypothetical protein